MCLLSRVRFLVAALILTAGLGLGIASTPQGAATASTILDASGTTFSFGVAGQTVTGGIGSPVAPGGSHYYPNVATIGNVSLDAKVTFVQGTNLRGTARSD
jgi:hypothetical protein